MAHCRLDPRTPLGVLAAAAVVVIHLEADIPLEVAHHLDRVAQVYLVVEHLDRVAQAHLVVDHLDRAAQAHLQVKLI